MAPQAKFSFFSTRESNNKIFSNQGRMESIKPYNVNDGLPEDYMISFANPHERVEYFLKAVPGNFKQAMEVAVQVIGREITCIISDAFFWFGADIAHELHVPWVPLWTAGPRPLLLHLETDLVRQKMGGDGKEYRKIEPWTFFQVFLKYELLIYLKNCSMKTQYQESQQCCIKWEKCYHEQLLVY